MTAASKQMGGDWASVTVSHDTMISYGAAGAHISSASAR